MAKILTDSAYYTAIANAIRKWLPDSAKMRPKDMAARIPGVYNAGFNAGHDAGYAQGDSSGHERGYAEGYEKGKLYGQTQEGFYDTFWDEFQNYGKTMSGHMLFAGRGWTENNFHPKYKNVRYTNGYMCFRNNRAVTDLSDWTIDLSTAGDCSYLFHTCYNVKHIGKIIMPEDPDSAGTNYLFTACQFLRKIDELQWNAKIKKSTSSFSGCLSLVNITFTGTIALSLDFGDCRKLSKDSIANIIGVLSGSSTGNTITFSKAAIISAFGATTSDEWVALIGTKTNWNFSLV